MRTLFPLLLLLPALAFAGPVDVGPQYPIQDSLQNNLLSNAGSLNVNTKTPITANAPASVSVGTSSTSVLAANASRKGLVIVNLSSANVSIGIATAGVLNSGITLFPGGVWQMDENTFSTGAINAVASAAASSISVQEFQ